VPKDIHNPYDIVMKRMVEADPLGMLRFVGLPGESATPFDADLSTITRQADYVLRVADPEYLAHLEFLGYYDTSMVRRLVLYAALAYHNHGLNVETALVLLRKEADSPALTGRIDYGSGSLKYRVIRIWEIGQDDLLNLPISLLPIAPVGNIAREELPSLVQQMDTAFAQAEVTSKRESDLWVETYLLLGLKYDQDFARNLLKPVVGKMRESTTYQAILEEGMELGEEKGKIEGKIEGELAALEIVGLNRFGEPSSTVREALGRITSPQRLEELLKRAFQVESWDDLLN
jgi:predicted transposase YdaD